MPVRGFKKHRHTNSDVSLNASSGDDSPNLNIENVFTNNNNYNINNSTPSSSPNFLNGNGNGNSFTKLFKQANARFRRRPSQEFFLNNTSSEDNFNNNNNNSNNNNNNINSNNNNNNNNNNINSTNSGGIFQHLINSSFSTNHNDTNTSLSGNILNSPNFIGRTLSEEESLRELGSIIGTRTHEWGDSAPSSRRSSVNPTIQSHSENNINKLSDYDLQTSTPIYPTNTNFNSNSLININSNKNKNKNSNNSNLNNIITSSTPKSSFSSIPSKNSSVSPSTISNITPISDSSITGLGISSVSSDPPRLSLRLSHDFDFSNVIKDIHSVPSPISPHSDPLIIKNKINLHYDNINSLGPPIDLLPPLQENDEENNQEILLDNQNQSHTSNNSILISNPINNHSNIEDKNDIEDNYDSDEDDESKRWSKFSFDHYSIKGFDRSSSLSKKSTEIVAINSAGNKNGNRRKFSIIGPSSDVSGNSFEELSRIVLDKYSNLTLETSDQKNLNSSKISKPSEAIPKKRLDLINNNSNIKPTQNNSNIKPIQNNSNIKPIQNNSNIKPIQNNSKFPIRVDSIKVVRPKKSLTSINSNESNSSFAKSPTLSSLAMEEYYNSLDITQNGYESELGGNLADNEEDGTFDSPNLQNDIEFKNSSVTSLDDTSAGQDNSYWKNTDIESFQDNGLAGYEDDDEAFHLDDDLNGYDDSYDDALLDEVNSVPQDFEGEVEDNLGTIFKPPRMPQSLTPISERSYETDGSISDLNVSSHNHHHNNAANNNNNTNTKTINNSNSSNGNHINNNNYNYINDKNKHNKSSKPEYQEIIRYLRGEKGWLVERSRKTNNGKIEVVGFEEVEGGII